MNNQEIVSIEARQSDGELVRMLILEDLTMLDINKGEWSSLSPVGVDFVESCDNVVFSTVKENGEKQTMINGIILTPFMRKTLIDFLIEQK